MNHAKFCPATQGRSTAESRKSAFFLPQAGLAAQQTSRMSKHQRKPLSPAGGRAVSTRHEVNRLIVNAGKSRASGRFG
jgi:hypothetical protein